MILIQIKVFGRNIKETTPDRYFIKVTARTSFTRLKVIRRKKLSSLNYKMENLLKNPVVSPYYLNLLAWNNLGTI